MARIGRINADVPLILKCLLEVLQREEIDARSSGFFSYITVVGLSQEI